MIIIVLTLSFLIITFTLFLNLLEELLNATVALVGGMLLLTDVYIHATKGPLPESGLLDSLMYIVSSHGRHRCIGGILPPNSRWRGGPLSLNILIIIAIAMPRSRTHMPLVLQ